MTTNYEKIKQMSVREMAKFLGDFVENACERCDCPTCEVGYDCKDGMSWWLLQEAEE